MARRRTVNAQRQRAAREILVHVGLGDFTRHYPHQLSGGMQQRVNLMQQMLLDLWHEFHMTVVFVTHDVDEAVFLSDRVLVLTKRPGTVKAELSINLPRPRSHELLTSSAFMELKRRALGLLLVEMTP